MRSRWLTKLLSVIGGLLILALFCSLWYGSPVRLLRGVEAADVASISVFNGNNGTGFDITDTEEIEAIVSSLQAVALRRDGISLNYSGYYFRLTFYGEDGRALTSFYLNGTTTVRKDPFFYRDPTGSLCVDYLESLAEHHAAA